MKLETGSETRFDNVTYQVRTPDGMMFVTVNHDTTGKPVGIIINIGKTGASVYAWSQAVARLTSVVLDLGGNINDLISELSNMVTDKVTILPRGEKCRSGIEGVVIALMMYRREQYIRSPYVVNGELGGRGGTERRPSRLGS